MIINSYIALFFEITQIAIYLITKYSPVHESTEIRTKYSPGTQRPTTSVKKIVMSFSSEFIKNEFLILENHNNTRNKIIS